MKSGSKLERLLNAGEFVVCGELGPPQSADPDAVRKKCKNFDGFESQKTTEARKEE